MATIHRWKHPEIGWLDKAMEVAGRPMDKAGEVVMNVPGVGTGIEMATDAIVRIANDAAQWSVRHDAILAEHREAGNRDVRSLDDVAGLDLAAVDTAIGNLKTKYQGVAMAEGTAAGIAGLAGLVADLPALTAISLRAVAEYATYCGFDPSSDDERVYAMNVLVLASSASEQARKAALAQLDDIATTVAQKNTWSDLEKRTFVVVLKSLARMITARLSSAKAGQLIPVAGAVVGGGFNALFVTRVCDAANNLYRERFLARKHGAQVISRG